ncbi:succinate-semialdehyde dehydrogenase [Devosia riboflavina]|uniref:Succinate-semialdehyde dehydrogenase n=1 Tax=Devosia riboflavina TaxID=46914 RepID=A0A087LZG9_9HYPH|nr:succinate-semialdehyde dehydrogenase [Devosia riboflavina]
MLASSELESLTRTDLFIGGAWRIGSADRIPVIDPSTANTITEVAGASTADALEAVEAAHAAAANWAATPPRRRSEILQRGFMLMIEHAEQLAQLISLENGKTLTDARGEVTYAAEFFRWFAEEAVRMGGETGIAPAGTNRMLVQYQPIGVSILITPWNFPAAMATRKLGPALAAGCTCVLKPANETPLTAFAIVALLEEAGLPPGVVNVVTTVDPAASVSAMLHHPKVRKLSFTGSTQVGRLLLKEAADTVLSCSMELGGNAPFIVLDDADLDAAVEGAMLAKMRNGGEACTAANRFIVHASLAARFADALAKRMSRLQLGPGYDPASGLGPMINRRAANRIAETVDAAKASGGRLLTGGDAARDCYYPATVIVDVPPSSTLVREEIFGPVASILSFETDDEAIALANDTEYGLASYLYAGDLRRGLALADRIEAGMVGLNRGLVSDPAAPFGGVKQSGLGREGAHHGILEFCETKYVAVQW